MMLNRFLLAAMAAVCLTTVCAQSGTARAQAMLPSLVQSGPLTFAPLVRRVVPAVVNIAVRMKRLGRADRIKRHAPGTQGYTIRKNVQGPAEKPA